MYDFDIDESFEDYEDIDNDNYFVEDSQILEDDYEDKMIDSYFTNETLKCITDEQALLIQQQEFFAINNDETLSEDEAVPEKVSYISSVTEQERIEENEKIEESRKIVIQANSWIVQTIKEAADVLERTSDKKESVRVYDKKAEMPKIKYSKATMKISGWKKFLLFLVACVIVGLFFAVYANSYKQAKINDLEQPTLIGCAFGWILVMDTLELSLSHIYIDVFWSAFAMGFGLLALIGLFVWFDSDVRKQSRVGHEHGAARLGNERDYKKFKKKFMER